jgi:hypothetical protein
MSVKRRREAPLSVLSDISPTPSTSAQEGEIGCVTAFPFACSVEGRGKTPTRAISPLAGEMPTGREGRLALTLRHKIGSAA